MKTAAVRFMHGTEAGVLGHQAERVTVEGGYLLGFKGDELEFAYSPGSWVGWSWASGPESEGVA